MRRAFPVLAGLAFFLAYVAWTVHVQEATTSGWGVVAEPLADRLRAFFGSEFLWMGASYSLSVGFTVFALSVFRENRKKAAAGAAGGVAMTGVVYGLGCFLLGCCGSPMLPIYVGLLGAKYAKVTGPLMFAVTLGSVALGVRMLRRKRSCGCEGSGPCEGDTSGS